MPRNVEIKARLREPRRTLDLVRKLAGTGETLIEQEDTFFPVPRGRMKVRRFSGGRGELIVYDRPDRAGPRSSDYHVVPTDRPDELREALATALGEAGTVRKRRRLYLTGQTRIHLDEVEGLGRFLELEVVLRPGQPAGEGEREARRLMRRLGVEEEDLVPRSYVDLLRDA
jgi:adenylate cyclase